MFRRWLARSLRFVSGVLPLARQARIVAFILPRRYWYRFARFASHAQGRLKTRTGGNGKLTEALMFDNWIRELTFSGAFPIPWVLGQADVLAEDKQGRGILYCWTHVPYVQIASRALFDLGYTVDYIVAHPGKIVEGNGFLIPGLKTHVQAISVDKRVLTKVRTALEHGKSVGCLADAEIFAPLSPEVLRIAGRVGAFVIFHWAELEPDGTLKVHFIPAPHPLCEDEQAIRVNLEFLRAMNRKTLAELGALPYLEPDGK